VRAHQRVIPHVREHVSGSGLLTAWLALTTRGDADHTENGTDKNGLAACRADIVHRGEPLGNPDSLN